MSVEHPVSDTDRAWEEWGQKDPYFAVLTLERFRSISMTTSAKQEFFASGVHHVTSLLKNCRDWVDPSFVPARVLDFGCGVGRVLIPLAAAAESAIGVDISPSMLQEARRNCDEQGLDNVSLVLSDDELSAVEGLFDLIHSSIVFQHIEVARGRLLFRSLLDHLAPNGVAAIHVTYGKAYHPDTFGQPPVLSPASASKPPARAWIAGRPGIGTLTRLWRKEPSLGGKPAGVECGRTPPVTPVPDPEMLMNPYPLSDLAYLMQSAGVQHFHASFTDHGGELGVFLFFKRSSDSYQTV